MGRRELKKSILAILGQGDLATVREGLARYRDGEVLSLLISALYSADERVRWHAVSALGCVVSRIAGQEMEAARIVMRRFLWSLNDESGGIGWGAPEAMAEIMVHHEPLAREYLHMLVSYMREDGPELFQDGNYIELPQLQQGLLWGIGRLCPRYGRELLAMGAAVDLRLYLFAENGPVRGLAVRCLGLLGETVAIRTVPQLASDPHPVRLYHEGRFAWLTVADLVSEALGPANRDS